MYNNTSNHGSYGNIKKEKIVGDNQSHAAYIQIGVARFLKTCIARIYTFNSAWVIEMEIKSNLKSYIAQSSHPCHLLFQSNLIQIDLMLKVYLDGQSHVQKILLTRKIGLFFFEKRGAFVKVFVENFQFLIVPSFSFSL